MMSEEEFDLLDELYFVQPYQYLKEELGWEDEKLLATLQLLIDKEWIKCFYNVDEEVKDNFNIEKEGKKYYYLATKVGLMEHNSS
jgi:hypothetical protein